MDEQRDGLIIGTWIGEENEGKNKESKKESERSGSTLSYRSAPTVCLALKTSVLQRLLIASAPNPPLFGNEYHLFGSY